MWQGLGTVAVDLVVLLIASSLLRHRIGLRAWRSLHWAAYLCWPAAVLHAIGNGTDGAQRVAAGWSSPACVAAVVAAGSGGWSVAGSSPTPRSPGAAADGLAGLR